jgi:hypothetical protein
MDVAPGYREFLQVLEQYPEKHLILKPDMVYDPEVVFYFKYLADKNGWAHTLQIHPDGSADVVRHRPEQLDHGVRWICRTPDQQALGIEPCTAEVEGFNTEKKKGNVWSLPGGATFEVELEVGVLNPAEAKREGAFIEEIIAGAAQ